MKTAIKLILIDLVITQLAAPILVMIPYTIYLLVTTGNLDKGILTQAIMIPAQLAGQVMMGIYLWKAGYISTQKATWSPVSAGYLSCSAWPCRQRSRRGRKYRGRGLQIENGLVAHVEKQV